VYPFWQSEYHHPDNHQGMLKRTSESSSDSWIRNLFQTPRSSGRSDHFRRNIPAVPDPFTIYASFLSNMRYIHVTEFVQQDAAQIAPADVCIPKN
jgi:hypothetical protein